MPMDNTNVHKVPSENQKKTAVVAWHLSVGVVLCVLGIFAFAILWRLVVGNGEDVVTFDTTILKWAFAHQAPGLTQIAIGLAWFGNPIVIVTVGVISTIAGFVWRKIRGAAWTFPVAIIGSGIIIEGIKLSVHRLRPELFKHLLKETGYSFPSGHSFISVVIYGLVAYFLMHLTNRKSVRTIIVTWAVVLIVLVSLSRVYVGVHYPTDVLAGWATGIPWLITCLGLHEVMARRWSGSGEAILNEPAGWDPASTAQGVAAGIKEKASAGK